MKARTSKSFEPYRVPGSATQYVMPTIPRTVRRRTAIAGAAAALALGLLVGVAVGHPGTRLPHDTPGTTPCVVGPASQTAPADGSC